jgi:hypothetical protein
VTATQCISGLHPCVRLDGSASHQVEVVWTAKGVTPAAAASPQGPCSCTPVVSYILYSIILGVVSFVMNLIGLLPDGVLDTYYGIYIWWIRLTMYDICVGSIYVSVTICGLV